MSAGFQMDNGSEWDDRRCAPRFPLQLPVKLKRDNDHFPGLTENVSATGMYFYIHPDTPIDSEIEFILTLPPEVTLTHPMQIKGKATVIRVSGTGAKGIGVAATIDSYELMNTAHA